MKNILIFTFLIIIVCVISTGIVLFYLKSNYPIKYSTEDFIGNSIFKSGQVWTYNNREGENDSRVIINKIEMYDGLGKVVHISITNLNSESKEIPHLPYAEDALIKSVKELESEKNELGNYMEGYNLWKKAYDTEGGGIWTLELKETIDLIEKVIDQQKS